MREMAPCGGTEGGEVGLTVTPRGLLACPMSKTDDKILGLVKNAYN